MISSCEACGKKGVLMCRVIFVQQIIAEQKEVLNGRANCVFAQELNIKQGKQSILFFLLGK